MENNYEVTFIKGLDTKKQEGGLIKMRTKIVKIYFYKC